MDIIPTGPTITITNTETGEVTTEATYTTEEVMQMMEQWAREREEYEAEVQAKVEGLFIDHLMGVCADTYSDCAELHGAIIHEEKFHPTPEMVAELDDLEDWLWVLEGRLDTTHANYFAKLGEGL